MSRFGWLASWVGTFAGVAAILTPGLASATHEVNHRFIVSGTVRTADGAPRSDVKVVVAHPRTQLSETVITDRSGSYSALLHLHDQDAGDSVTVTVGDEVKTIKAAYDPLDHHSPRTAYVDFGQGSDTATTAAINPGWWYGIGGVVVVGGVWYFRARTRKHRATSPRKGVRRESGARHKVKHAGLAGTKGLSSH